MVTRPLSEDSPAKPGPDPVRTGVNPQPGANLTMTQHLTVSVTVRPSRVMVLVGGECDAGTADQLRDILFDQGRPSAPLVVADLSGLSFIDVAVAHALVEAHDRLAGKGKRLVLLSPQQIVARVLELTCIDQLIPVCRSLGDVPEAK